MAGFGELKGKKKSTPQRNIQAVGAALHKMAVDHHKRGDLLSAEKAYREAIKTGYVHSAVFSNMGVICHYSGRPEEAILLYKKAIELSPIFSDAYVNLGGLYKDLGQLDQALASTLKSLELKPDNPDALTNLGAIYKDLGQLDQALASTLKSLELKPDHPTVHMNLGLIYRDLGQLDQALALTQKALELKPDHPTLHMNLGGIYRDLGQLNQALDSTLKSLELKSDNPTAHMNLGGIYRDLGQLDLALASMLKSLELKPDHPQAHLNLGGIYRDLGQLDQALASTLKSLELKPDNPTAHMNLGGIYKQFGQLDQALASTLKSLELNHNNPTAQMNLGGIYRDLGQLDQALAFLKKAMKSENRNEKAAIELAQTYCSMGNYRDGVVAISNIHSKKSGNLLLSLYLCLDEKLEFNRCADDLIGKRWLDSQGIAAIDHANVIYNQMLDNGLCGESTINSIFVQSINEQEFSDALIQEILIRLSSGSLQSRMQGLLVNGQQTSGNILDLPEKPFQVLKELLVRKIDEYNQSCDINTDRDFKVNWEKNLYILRGWAIILDKGGNLKSHNHETGWLTGTFYLQMPEEGANAEEGAIEFSHQGPKYPEGTSVFNRRVIRPNARDLNIFSSALFHRTLPFQSEMQRICIAFDVTRNENLLDVSS